MGFLKIVAAYYKIGGMKVQMIYIVIINLVTAGLFAADKRRAQKGMWRISEKTLIGLSLLGGSIGALFAMHVFRHKSIKFRWILPAIFMLQLGILTVILLWKAGVLHGSVSLPFRL
jgi:uncharacterized membrane protein YsdA (DUF1294 family)